MNKAGMEYLQKTFPFSLRFVDHDTAYIKAFCLHRIMSDMFF